MLPKYKSEAVALGLKKYDSGKICPRGHGSVRFVANGTCVICTGDVERNWRHSNSDRRRAKMSAYMRETYQANKKARSASTKAWRKRNIEKYKAYMNAYHRSWRALNSAVPGCRNFKAQPPWAQALRAEFNTIYERALTMRLAGIDVEVDHIIPIRGRIKGVPGQFVCGLHVPWNLRIVAKSSNRARLCYLTEQELYEEARSHSHAETTSNGPERTFHSEASYTAS